MGGPQWLADSLAVIMLVTSAYTLARVVAARLWRRSLHYDVNVAHVAMGVAMAGMLVPALRSFPAGVWEVFFGVLVVWFLARTVRFVNVHGWWGWDDERAHHVSHFFTHLVMAAGMLYMFLAGMYSGSAVGITEMASTMAGGSGSILAPVLVLGLVASAVWHVDGLTRFVALPAGGDGSGGGPGGGDGSGGDSGGGGGSEGASQVGRALLAPRLESACHIAMAVTMGYMLVLLR